MSNLDWIDDLIDQLTNDETKDDDRVELKSTQQIKQEPAVVEPAVVEPAVVEPAVVEPELMKTPKM
jgi:hypothetical protein